MTQLKEILKMSIGDRIHLVEAIWDSIVLETASPKIDPVHKKVIEKRLKEYLANPKDIISWEKSQKALKKLL